MLQKVLRLELPGDIWRSRLPDAALEAFLNKVMGQLGGTVGATPRQILQRQEQLVMRLERDPSLTWEKALAEMDNSTAQQSSNSRSEALRKLKL
jgi:hypothetical protein